MFSPISVAIFLLGAIVASFIGVVVARLNTGQSIFSGRSRCDICDTTLSSLMLVPIISYLASGGKAQCCGAKISYQAPLTEIFLGGLFVLAYSKIGLSIALPLVFVSMALVLALVLYDLSHQILPSSLLYPFVAMSIAASVASQPQSDFMGTLVAAVLIAASLALIHILSQGRAMGFADAPFAFGLSMLVGGAAFSGFIFSFWIGAVSGIIILARRPKGSRMGVEVPFAPYLAAGFLLAYFTQWNPFALTELLIRQIAP
ncbi:MAG: prepilin peptidase [bacterium]|nr:prepilin peptidase [bacterium]